MRGASVVAQMLLDGHVQIVPHRIQSAGSELGLARGDLGDVRAVQMSADRQWFIIRCDFADVRIRATNDFSKAAAEALWGCDVRMPEGKIRDGLESDTFTADRDGRPKKVQGILT